MKISQTIKNIQDLNYISFYLQIYVLLVWDIKICQYLISVEYFQDIALWHDNCSLKKNQYNMRISIEYNMRIAIELFIQINVNFLFKEYVNVLNL